MWLTKRIWRTLGQLLHSDRFDRGMLVGLLTLIGCVIVLQVAMWLERITGK